MVREPLGSGATVLAFGGAQRQMLPGPVGDLETARLASGAANVVAYIANPAGPSSETGSCTWAEAVGPGGQAVTAELRVGEGVSATADIAAETARRVRAGTKPGAWIPGQLFGASLVTEATGAQVTVNGQRHERQRSTLTAVGSPARTSRVTVSTFSSWKVPSRLSIGTSEAPACHHYRYVRTRTGSKISVARMVDDTVMLLELLRDRFGGKTIVTGFSFGATFAAYAAVRRPDLVAALVAEA